MSDQDLNIIDDNLTDEDRKFIRKYEKFKDDLVTLLNEGVIKDIITNEMDNTEYVDFYSDRNKRQLNPTNPIIVARINKPEELYKHHARELRSQYGINNFQDLEKFAKQEKSDSGVAHDNITSFLAYVVNKELTQKITRSLFQVTTDRFKEMQAKNKEEELDLILLFSSIFGVTVQFDKANLDRKKVFIRMIL